jgi:UDP-glucose 6-dehydrogenase
MKVSVTRVGFDWLVARMCFAELGHMVTGIDIHTKELIETDLIPRTIRVGTNDLIQQNIERRKPPNSKAKVIKN